MIRIRQETDIELTQEQYNRYHNEYKKAMMFYAGHYISFETWLRYKLRSIHKEAK